MSLYESGFNAMLTMRARQTVLFDLLLITAILLGNCDDNNPAFAQNPAADGSGLDNRYALLIGVHTYDKASGLRPLNYTHDDVTALASLLEKVGYRKENIVLMTDSQNNPKLLPERQKILDQLSYLLRDRAPQDSVLVALAGHGVQFGKNTDSYFCPLDAALDNKSTLVSIDQIYSELHKCKAGSKIVLSDSCRNDPFESATRGLSLLDEDNRALDRAPPNGVVTFYSCSGGESAYEDSDIHHGVFFYFVLRAMSGEADFDLDGRITLPELELFTKQNVTSYVRSGFNGARQMPALRGETSGLIALSVVPGDGSLIGTIGRPQNAPANPQSDERRPTMAYRYAEVEDSIAAHLDVPPGSVWITSLFPSGAADRAGLRPGDVIQSINGKPIRDIDSLVDVVSSEYKTFTAHTSLSVSVFRDRSPVVFKVQPRIYAKNFDFGDYWQTNDPAERRHILSERCGPAASVQMVNSTMIVQSGIGRGVELWDIGKDRCVPLKVPVRNVICASVCSDGKTAVLGDKDGRLTIWSFKDNLVVKEFLGESRIHLSDVVISADGQTIVEISTKGVLTRWRSMDGKQLNSVDLKKMAIKANHIGFITRSTERGKKALVRTSVDGNLVYGSADIGTLSFDFTDNRFVKVPDGVYESSSVVSHAYSENAKTIAVGLNDGRVRILDSNTNEVLHDFAGHAKRVDAIAFCGDELVVSASASERALRVWSLVEDKEVWQFALEDKVGPFNLGPSCVAVSPDRKTVWAGAKKIHEFAIPKHLWPQFSRADLGKQMRAYLARIPDLKSIVRKEGRDDDAANKLANDKVAEAFVMNPKLFFKHAPDSIATMYYSTGVNKSRADEYHTAIVWYMKAIKADDSAMWPRNNISYILSTCPDVHIRDGVGAVRYAVEACEKAQWQYWGFLDTLACALAEAGEYDKSIECFELAKRLAVGSHRVTFEENEEVWKTNLERARQKKRPVAKMEHVSIIDGHTK